MGSVVLPEQKELRHSSPSGSTYSIEVCQGPDCTGLGGGVAVLEIEELVRECHYQQQQQQQIQNRDSGSIANDNDRIRVVEGGCRDVCSVGPNAHILVRHAPQKTSRRRRTVLLESVSNVKDAAACDRVVHRANSYASWAGPSPTDGPGTAHEPTAASASTSSSSMDRHRSLMTRRAERKRWEALKDVSRRIAKCKKTVAAAAASTHAASTPLDQSSLQGKARIWKQTCQDRIVGGPSAPIARNRQSQRDQRRTERLVAIASEKLDRICLQLDDDDDDDESDDSSSYSSSSSGSGD